MVFSMKRLDARMLAARVEWGAPLPIYTMKYIHPNLLG